MKKIRLAVLVSGNGSNLQAIIDAIQLSDNPLSDNPLNAEIVGVFSNKKNAFALSRVPSEIVWAESPKAYPSREAFDLQMAKEILKTSPDYIICAGYMRILSEAFIEQFKYNLINIHPSLLPKHRGLNSHAQAIAAGDSHHGASVHFVSPELDAGPVIAQTQLCINKNDTPDTLAQRLLPQEHQLLVAVIRYLVAGRIEYQNDIIYFDKMPLIQPLLISEGNNSV